MLTLAELEVTFNHQAFCLPSSSKEAIFKDRIKPRLSEQSKKPILQRNNMKYLWKKQKEERTHSDIKRRIMTAGGKKRLPKDFFDDKANQNISDVFEESKNHQKKEEKLELKIVMRAKTEAEETQVNDQETPKFIRSPFDFQKHNIFPENQFIDVEETMKPLALNQISQKDQLPVRKPITLIKKTKKVKFMKQKNDKMNISSMLLPQLTRK